MDSSLKRNSTILAMGIKPSLVVQSGLESILYHVIAEVVPDADGGAPGVIGGHEKPLGDIRSPLVGFTKR